MNPREAFDQIMQNTVNMALATSTDDRPNLRVVTFGWDAANPKTVYFTTFKGNQKTREFAQNPHVALLPLPEDADAPAQVRIFGKVRPAGKSLEEIAPWILAKMPSFSETMKAAGPMLEVYEVNYDEVQVTIGMADAQTIKL